MPSFRRQEASAFNQPLSLDTSKVTDMGFMFQVRPARVPFAQSPVGPFVCMSLAPPSLRHAPPPDWPHPHFVCPPFDLAESIGVQPAAES